MQELATHYEDVLERHADSAWRTLKLMPPADIQAICDRLKVHLAKRELFPDLAASYSVNDTGDCLIIVNKLDPPPRQRFSIAHEIGHHLLRTPGQTGIICQLTTEKVKDETERRCDRFAAALLMPHWLTRQWYDELRDNPSGRVPIMADRFGVSKTALRFRIKELNL